MSLSLADAVAQSASDKSLTPREGMRTQTVRNDALKCKHFALLNFKLL